MNQIFLIQHGERSELRLHFEWTKLQKWFILASFWKPESCSQTVLGQKFAENAKIENFRWDIFINIQTILISVTLDIPL